MRPRRTRSWRRESYQSASGKPGAVQFLDIGAEYLALSDRFAPELLGASSPDFDKVMQGPDGASDKAGAFGFNLMTRIQTRPDLEALWAACEGRDGAQLRRLLWFMGARETTAGLVVNRVWLAERAVRNPDWLGCRAELERAVAAAVRIGLPGLAHGAACGIVRVEAEELKDPDAALRSADAYAAQLGWSPGLENEKATVLS